MTDPDGIVLWKVAVLAGAIWLIMLTAKFFWRHITRICLKRKGLTK